MGTFPFIDKRKNYIKIQRSREFDKKDLDVFCPERMEMPFLPLINEPIVTCCEPSSQAYPQNSIHKAKIDMVAHRIQVGLRSENFYDAITIKVYMTTRQCPVNRHKIIVNAIHSVLLSIC